MRGRRDPFAGQIPAAVEELPRNLKGDERFACARSECKQDAVFLGGDCLHRPFDCQVLIIACLEKSAPVLKRDLGEAVPPGVCFGKSQVPEFFRRRILRNFAFRPLLHVDAVDALAVGGIGIADGELSGVALRLSNPFGQWFVPSLGLHHCQLVVAVHQDVVGYVRLGPLPVAFDAAQRDVILAQDTAALIHTPARRLEGRIDILGSGFGFIHAMALQFPGECLVQQRFFQFLQRGELLLVDGFEALGFGVKGIELAYDLLLLV